MHRPETIQQWFQQQEGSAGRPQGLPLYLDQAEFYQKEQARLQEKSQTRPMTSSENRPPASMTMLDKAIFSFPSSPKAYQSRRLFETGGG
jgi:hypothetical protein